MISKNNYDTGLIMKKLLYVALLSIVPVFFILVTMLMTLTGEDILHKTASSSQGFWQTLAAVYGYLPRLGEFLQRIVIEYYEYQVNGEPVDAMLRLFDALMCAGLVFVTAMVIMGRRIKLTSADIAVILLTFLGLILSRYNEVFMMRFSFIHNYLPILLSMAAALYLLFYAKRSGRWIMALSFITGYVVGMSSEIVPIAFLIVGSGFALYYAKKQGAKQAVMSHLPKVLLFAGVITGMAVMMSNGAIFNRSSQAYADVYDYVSLSGLTHDTIGTIMKLASHAVFNARYILSAVMAMVLFLLVELYLRKTKRTNLDVHVRLHIALLSFVVLYMTAASQISVLDDLYPRFMSPIHLAVVVSFGAFAYHITQLIKPPRLVIGVVIVAAMALSLVATIDVYKNLQRIGGIYSHEILRIKSHQDKNVCVDKAEFERVRPSPLFKFKTLPPFEEWTGHVDLYNKKIYYAGSIDPLNMSLCGVK